MTTADLPKDGKPPLTFPPNLAFKKGSVTADKLPMTPPGDLCLKNLLNMPPLMVKGCEMRLDLSTGLTEESHTLPVVAYTAVPNKGRRDLFFFCFFFSF